MATVGPDDVWLYVYDHGKVRTRDLEQAFVKTRKMSRSTLYKYKRLLQAQGKITSTPVHAQPPYNIYTVPPQYHRVAEALKSYSRLPSEYYYIHTGEHEWQDTPEGFYLTPVKEKILWQNPETGAMITINKFPVGLSDAPHVHPDASVMVYVLSGEFERPDGTRTSLAGDFKCRPKGTLDLGYKVTKEATIIAFWDGPRTKIDLKMDSVAFEKAYAQSLGNHLTYQDVSKN